MSIQRNVTELQLIKNELKEMGARAKALRLRAKTIEDQIAIYLKSKDQQGVKYKGVAIIIEHKPKRLTKKKQDQDDDALAVLRKQGMDAVQAEQLLKDVLEARRGLTSETAQIKFKTLKEQEK
jgi:hypothetical protein